MAGESGSAIRERGRRGGGGGGGGGGGRKIERPDRATASGDDSCVVRDDRAVRGNEATSRAVSSRTSFCDSGELSQFRKNSSSLSLDEGNRLTLCMSMFPAGRGGGGVGEGGSTDRVRVRVRATFKHESAVGGAFGRGAGSGARTPRARIAPDVSARGFLPSAVVFTLSPAMPSREAEGATHCDGE